MSIGSKSIPLLKSAPAAEQLADRLGGGEWRGIEIALMPADVADEDALDRAVRTVSDVRVHHHQLAITAEAPIAWPSGAFVRVDRLDDEARSGIERSAEFAARVGSPVLTIHLFIPLSPAEFRASGAIDADGVEEFLGFYAEACVKRGVDPLIENVPPILRMRTGGVFL
jgi:sugar phosphate isomerase/epimerase